MTATSDPITPGERFAEIEGKIACGEATIMTAEELRKLVRTRGPGSISIDEVDVVTTATKALMSGTLATFSIPVAGPDAFVRAKRIWLNGVPGFPGPAPNERLGIVDCVVYGTAHSRDRPERYGGGHLFRDMAERKRILITVEALDGQIFNRELTVDDIPYAVLSAVRNCFRNYSAFVNASSEPLTTIFALDPLEGPFKGATVSGCGEINPVENDPGLAMIGVGTRFLFNGAVGYITGQGTRSSSEKPNLTGYADLHDMDPRYMGGFLTSAGPEVIVSWAVPIPIVSRAMLEDLHALDNTIPLKVVDLRGRRGVGAGSYADVWQGTDHSIMFNPNLCTDCNECPVEHRCPTSAFSRAEKFIDKRRCFNCGACVRMCSEHAFVGNLGEIRFESMTVPIILRQSDRFGANQLAHELKRRILSGEFKITYPLAGI